MISQKTFDKILKKSIEEMSIPNMHIQDRGISQHVAEHMPHIGMRKTKTLVAIFVGFWLWQAVRIIFPGLEVHPIFIYICGVIEIRNSSEKTVDMGKIRVKVTFIALGIGLPLIALANFLKGRLSADWMRVGVELAVLLIGTLLSIIIAEETGCKVQCGLTAVIFIVLVVSCVNDDQYLYAVLRAGQTLVGVFVVWLINVKLLPYPPVPKAKKPEGAEQEEGLKTADEMRS